MPVPEPAVHARSQVAAAHAAHRQLRLRLMGHMGVNVIRISGPRRDAAPLRLRPCRLCDRAGCHCVLQRVHRRAARLKLACSCGGRHHT